MNFKYICTDCDDDETRFKTTREKNLKKHVSSKHPKSNIQFKYKYNCKLRTTDEKPCVYKTDDKAKYTIHLTKTKKHGNQPTLQCTLCNQMFYVDHHLYDHVKLHLDEWQEELFFCDQCPFFIDTQERLESHYTSIHLPKEKKTYPCIYEYCTYIGEYPSSLKYHVITKHSLERPFACDMCTDTFKLRETLKTHEVTHSADTPFHCDTCDFKTKTRGRLTSHVYWHDPVYNFNCHVCPRVYAALHHLERHLETTHAPDVIACVKKQREYQVYLFLLERGLNLAEQLTINLQSVFKDETFFYVDFHFEFNGILFLLEVDEEMHSRYGVECDSLRMYKILTYMFVKGEERPIVFLRYNPDRFTCNGVKYTHKTYDRTTRMEELYDFIITCQIDNPYSIKYFCYDSNDDTTLITEHPDYNQHIKPYVI